jgi:hypothetical protein
MEGMFLQSVPAAGSLLAGAILLAVVAAAVAYGRLSRKEPRATEGREPLRKAA